MVVGTLRCRSADPTAIPENPQQRKDHLPGQAFRTQDVPCFGFPKSTRVCSPPKNRVLSTISSHQFQKRRSTQCLTCKMFQERPTGLLTRNNSSTGHCALSDQGGCVLLGEGDHEGPFVVARLRWKSETFLLFSRRASCISPSYDPSLRPSDVSSLKSSTASPAPSVIENVDLKKTYLSIFIC